MKKLLGIPFQLELNDHKSKPKKAHKLSDSIDNNFSAPRKHEETMF